MCSATDFVDNMLSSKEVYLSYKFVSITKIQGVYCVYVGQNCHNPGEKELLHGFLEYLTLSQVIKHKLKESLKTL